MTHVLATATLALVLAGCGGGADDDDGSPGAGAGKASDGAARLPDEAGHVHGLTVNASGTILLGTHQGMFRVTATEVQKVGTATVDLMGLAGTAGRLVASGHPGPGADLPHPLGLVESRDEGRTWQPVSRGGESDFHALAVSGTSIYGHDGTLRVSTDGGRNWTDRGPAVAPAALAADPADPDTVLATTADGVQVSTDAGRTFRVTGGGLVLQTLAWAAPGALFGVEPSGKVHFSADGGRTWQPRGQVPGQPRAVGAADARTVAVAIDGAVLVSTDGGASFRTQAAAG